MDPSPHQLARIIALRQSSGSEAKSLLALEDRVNHKPVQKPILRKTKKSLVNHQSKHKTLLKNIESQNRLQSIEREDEVRHEKEKMMRLRLKSVGNVESKVFSRRKQIQEDKSAANQMTTTMSSISNIHNQKIQMNHNRILSKKDHLSTTASDDKSNRDTMVKHDNFGRVPRYILERRIEMAEEDQHNQSRDKENVAEKENQKYNLHPNGQSTILLSQISRVPSMRGPERNQLLRALNENEHTIKKELEKLPFGLQSEGSIRKRDLLHGSIKEIEHAKRVIMSTPTLGRRRR